MNEQAFNYIETFPGVVVAVIDKRNAEHLLSVSQFNENKYMAGLVKFSELSEDDCSALIAKHAKFGFFEFPIITKELAISLHSWDDVNKVSSYQKWKDTAKLSLLSACNILNNLFNPKVDYIYIKIQTEFAL